MHRDSAQAMTPDPFDFQCQNKLQELLRQISACPRLTALAAASSRAETLSTPAVTKKTTARTVSKRAADMVEEPIVCNVEQGLALDVEFVDLIPCRVMDVL